MMAAGGLHLRPLFLFVFIALPRLLSCGGCDSGGGSEPPDGFNSAPHFVLVTDGDGAANEAPLWPLRVGARFGDAVCEGKTTRAGLELLRYVYSEQNIDSLPDERPERVSWYSRAELGLTFHGSTLGGFLVHPVLFVPEEVRVGMAWETGSPDAPLTFEITERALEETMWGLRTVWSLRNVANNHIVRFAEGLGPIDEMADEGVRQPIRRASLPAEDQPGIDLEWDDAVAPQAIQTVDSAGGVTGDLEYVGTDDPVSFVSGHALSGQTAQLVLHQRGGGACFALRAGDGASGEASNDTSAFGELEPTDCPLSSPGARALVAPVSHAGVAVPVGDKVYYAQSLPRAVVGLPDVTAEHSYLTTFVDAEGLPQRLGHSEAPASLHRDRRTRALRVYGPDDEAFEARVANSWLAVDQTNQYIGNLHSDDGQLAFAPSGPRHVLAHRFHGAEGPLPVTLIGLSGTVLSATFDVSDPSRPELSRPELEFFKAGNANTVLFDDHRELLITTADGLVHRLEPTADGGRRLVRIAQIELPSRETLVGAFRPTAVEPGLDVPLVAVTALRQATCDEVDGCTRVRRLYWIAGIEPLVEQSPRSLDVSAVRDGLDVLVCWPRELGPPSAASGWRLAGAEPAAIVEEPEGVGSCVLLLRDVSSTPDLASPGLFHVEATLPGVGALQMAAVQDARVFPEGLESYTLDRGQGPHAVSAGGFVTLSGVYGVSGALLGQAAEADAEAGAEVRDFGGAGLWQRTRGGTMAEPTSTWTLLNGSDAGARFELDYDGVQVPTAQGGILSCEVLSALEHRCEHLFADGSRAPRPDLDALDRRTHGLPLVELGDGTVCGERTLEGPPVDVRSWCRSADGVELEGEAMPTGATLFPVESGLFVFEAGVRGVRYLDATTLTVRSLDERCALSPTLDAAGDVWAMMVGDGATACDGSGAGLVLARLRPDGVTDVSIPTPADVYGEGSEFGAMAIGEHVLVLLTAPGERTRSELGAAVDVVGPSLYRLPRGLLP